jgi:hypothetical protein
MEEDGLNTGKLYNIAVRYWQESGNCAWDRILRVLNKERSGSGPEASDGQERVYCPGSSPWMRSPDKDSMR